jgi:hypothetical protein
MEEEKKTTGKATQKKISGERVSIIKTRAQVEARENEISSASQSYQQMHCELTVFPSRARGLRHRELTVLPSRARNPLHRELALN